MTDKSKENSKTDTPMKGDRIAKVIARAGLCSRRDAERWIADGRVAVSGDILSSPACTVTDADQVVVDGRPLQAAEQTRLFLYHKKPGLITSSKMNAAVPPFLTICRLPAPCQSAVLISARRSAFDQ